MTQQVRTASPLPPPIAVGGRVNFQGMEQTVLGISSLPQDGHALFLRLRGADGTHEAVMLEEVYADLSRAAIASPEPRRPHGPGCRSDTRGGDAPHGYLGRPFAPSAPHAVGTASSGQTHAEPASSQGRQATQTGAGPGLDVGALLQGLPEAAAARAQAKYEHLLEATTGFRDGVGADPAQPEPDPRYNPATSTLDERLRAKAEELGTTSRTVYRWHAQYRADGIWGLVSGNAKREIAPLAGLDPRIIEAIVEQADVAETNASTGTRKRFYLAVKRRLSVAYAGEPDAPTLPPFSTMQAKIDHIVGDRKLFSDASSRRTRALSPRKTFHPFRAVRPGQVIMMDATRLDVRLYDPQHDLNVSVTLTLAIDLCTRTIVAWRIVPGAENRADAVLLLADMMRPEPMRPHWRQELSHRLLGLPDDVLIDHDIRFASAAAKPVIYPETLIVDHGKVYVSDAFRHGCERLGVNLQLARTVQPTDKPAVERLFGRIRDDFSQHVAGFKGRNVANRGPLAEAQARHTLAELEELFAQYVVAVYQRSPHHGLRSPLDPSALMSPNEAFAAAVARAGWVPAPVDPFLYFQLLPIKWVKLHRWGIQINYRVYDAPILRRYVGAASRYAAPITAKGRAGGRAAGQRPGKELWPIRVDPRDVLHAYFLDPDDEQWHELTWAAGSDLEPFSEAFYEHARAWLRQRTGTNPNEEDLVRAIAELQEAAGAPENWSAGTLRQLAHSGERARAAARDRATATPPSPSGADYGQLQLAPEPPTGPDEWEPDPWDRDPRDRDVWDGDWGRGSWDVVNLDPAEDGRRRPVRRPANEAADTGLWPEPGAVRATPLARAWNDR